MFPGSGWGTMGMSTAYIDASVDEAQCIRDDPPGLGTGCHARRHRGGLRPLHERRTGGGCALRGRRLPGRPRHQIRHDLPHRSVLRESSTAPRPTSALPSKDRCARLDTDSIDLCYQHRFHPTRRSKRPQVLWPSWLPRARSVTSACPRPPRTRSAVPQGLPPRHRVAVGYLLWTRATRRPQCCRRCVSLGLASWPTRPWGGGC